MRELHALALALLQTSPTLLANPPWQWAAAWFAIGAALAGAASTWFSQRRNRINSIMPKIGFHRDLKGKAWVMENFGQGNAADILFGELDTQGRVANYIQLYALPKDRAVAFLDTHFRHCITLVAKYTDTTGKWYFAICSGEKVTHPRRDPYPEWGRMKPVQESALQAHIIRTGAQDVYKQVIAKDEELQVLKNQIATLRSVPFSLPDGPGWTRLEDGTIISPIDGRWFEIIERRSGRYYSIVRVQYDAGSYLHPFLMEGRSFSWDGERHSNWHTRYVRITQDGRGLSLEYIFTAAIKGAEPREGYGVSRFMSAGGEVLVQGEGSYLAVEEPTLYRCPYDLIRIDYDFKKRVGAQAESLDTIESMQRFVRLAHPYFPMKGGR